ncbi:hypothetical protein PY546_11805 [Providencia stuartii]|nr:hypothetical protein [Providencia stuartii]
MSNEEKNTILTNIQAKLTAKYGKKTSLLGDLEKAKQQPAVTCRITMSFYDHILAMPDSQKKAAFFTLSIRWHESIISDAISHLKMMGYCFIMLFPCQI